MSLKDFVIGGLAVLALAVGVVGVNKQPEMTLGAFSGPEIYDTIFFKNNVVVGGDNFATTSQGAATYTAATIKNARVITHTAGAALTATLPASTTLTDFIPRSGDTATKYLLPVTTGITLEGGTGTDLNTASSTKFCVAGQVCELTFVRKSNSDIEVLLVPASGN